MNRHTARMMQDTLNKDLEARVVVSYFYKGEFLKSNEVITNLSVGDTVTISIDGTNIS